MDRGLCRKNVDLTSEDPTLACPLILMRDCNRPQTGPCYFATHLMLILETTHLNKSFTHSQ